jgi:uncharacterized protein
MTRIGLLSDTHGCLDDRIIEHLSQCDEVWHCGDFGNSQVADRLAELHTLRGVYGNIDSGTVRYEFPEFLAFRCEQVNVLMTHIGGYPGHYNPQVYHRLINMRPQLFVCGHSHILKVQYDRSLSLLAMNPGAAGNFGIHTVRTLLRFEIDGDKIQNLEVVEMPKHCEELL